MNWFRRAIGGGSALALVIAGLALAQASPAQAAPVALSCGANISANTTLAADLGPCPGTAINLVASNITLNLNGHTVTGPNLHNGDTPGIQGTSVSGDTVENGTVTGFDTGVFFQTGDHNKVTRIYAHDNIGPPDGNNIFGEGIQTFEETNHAFTSNLVVHNGPFAGMDFFDTSNSTIANNTVLNNNVLEPTTDHCGSPQGCMQDIGIWVVWLGNGASGNTVSGNIVTGSGLDGIQMSQFTDGNAVTRNVVANNGFGQVPDNGSPGPRDGDGIIVFGTNTKVTYNTASKNAAKGIRIINSDGTPGYNHDTVEFNTAAGNGGGINSAGIGFDMADTNPNCGTDIWHHNTLVTSNQPCIKAP